MAVYTTIDDPSAFHQNDTYTGNGSDGTAKTFSGNSNLLPGLLYMHKTAPSAPSGGIMTTSHPDVGIGRSWIRGSTPSATDSIVNSFDSDGYTLGGSMNGTYYSNQSSSSYAVAAWKTGGTSATSNSDGDITSSVVVDTTMGLSLVKYTGNGTDNQTIGHGLGKRPQACWIYPIDLNSTQRPWWWEANDDGYAISNGLNDSSNAQENDLNGTVSAHSSGEGTTSIFTVSQQNSSYDNTNKSGSNYLAVVWTGIQGFSKFGSYIGNGNSDGMFVYTGFKPATVIIRNMDAGASVNNYDNGRDPTNEMDGMINWTDRALELSDSNTKVDFLSNGFKIRTSGTAVNGNNQTIGYCAWAESPLVTSTGIPTTAR